MRRHCKALAVAVAATILLAGPGLACAEAKNRTAIPLDSRTFVTIKDDAEWEYVHLYRLEGDKLVLIDSVAVRQDHQVDRIIEFRRTTIEKRGD